MKYNIEKNKKFLKAMEPTEVDKLLLWLFLFLGLYGYIYQWNEVVLYFLSIAILYKLVAFLLWFIHSVVHYVFCLKRGVSLDE